MPRRPTTATKCFLERRSRGGWLGHPAGCRLLSLMLFLSCRFFTFAFIFLNFYFCVCLFFFVCISMSVCLSLSLRLTPPSLSLIGAASHRVLHDLREGTCVFKRTTLIFLPSHRHTWHMIVLHFICFYFKWLIIMCDHVCRFLVVLMFLCSFSFDFIKFLLPFIFL